MDNITSALKSFYAKSFAEYGANAKGVNWGSEEKAEIRHVAMAGVLKPENGKKLSLLDVGCGYGEFYKYLIEKKQDVEYFGIDVVPEMIHYAKKQYGENNFVCADIFTEIFTRRYDYVICNGILTQKFGAKDEEMDLFMENLVEKMFSLATKGLAFNVMSSYVDFKEDKLFYKNPAEVFRLCMKYSRRLVIDHSYPLYEFTTYLYKEQ